MNASSSPRIEFIAGNTMTVDGDVRSVYDLHPSLLGGEEATEAGTGEKEQCSSPEKPSASTDEGGVRYRGPSDGELDPYYPGLTGTVSSGQTLINKAGAALVREALRKARDEPVLPEL